MKGAFVVEILAFAGCPHVEQARSNVRKALGHEGLSSEIREIEVNTHELALSQRFLGSPSVRVNGVDVEDAASTRSDYGLMCRTYSVGAESFGFPGVEMIRSAIQRHVSRQSR